MCILYFKCSVNCIKQHNIYYCYELNCFVDNIYVVKNKRTTKGSFLNILMERQEELCLLSFVVSLFVFKKSIRFKFFFYYIPALIYYYFSQKVLVL